MKVAYFDCLAGASGDMILGALLDAGLAEQSLQDVLDALHLSDAELRCHRVLKNGFSATKLDVVVADDTPERHLSDIEEIVRQSALSPGLKDRSVAVFRRLGQVEANIHGVSLDEVHLHELGGVDTLVDVVGTLSGLEALGIERVYSSPLPLGRGFVQGAHGQIPLPAPATVALLKGVPMVGSDLDMELVTPTGAVLLSSLAESFGPIPAMTLTAVGYGAGCRDLPIPNVLRILIGDRQMRSEHPVVETLVKLETNVDDLNPEIYDHVMARLFKGGALDVFMSPIQMKKNRPGTWLHVLCRPADADLLEEILFAETSTLGVRQQLVGRHALTRASKQVETAYGPVQVKIAQWGPGQTKAAPEYEDCRRLAELHDVPLREVYRAAEAALGQITPGS
ncbi:MAG: nickel pincer cofactor biosynthesis protein LarC [Anaerolineae bacterium]